VRETKTLNLLLVEDDLEDERLLCDALLEIEENRQWCNWRSSSIVPVDRLSDALDCLRREAYDAVLLNLSLPDSPALLHTFLEVHSNAGRAPVLVLADEPDEYLANQLLRAGAQDILVKAELECAPLARSIQYGIERQRLVNAARASAFVDNLTGVLTRDAFLTVAAHRSQRERLALVEIAADREALDPQLIQAAETLRGIFESAAVLGRWDRHRFCVLAPDADLHRAASQLTEEGLHVSITRLEDMPDGVELPLLSKIAMLAD
jgi:PleD family two-component response regulator